LRPEGIAFFFHAPGLRLVFGRRLGRRTKRWNVVALFVTMVAMATAYILVRDAVAPVLAWAICHVIWGSWLAARVLRGRDSL